MDIVEMILDASIASLAIMVILFVIVAAIVYAVIKKKKDYNSTGIPKRTEDPKGKEGSTDAK